MEELKSSSNPSIQAVFLRLFSLETTSLGHGQTCSYGDASRRFVSCEDINRDRREGASCTECH